MFGAFSSARPAPSRSVPEKHHAADDLQAGAPSAASYSAVVTLSTRTITGSLVETFSTTSVATALSRKLRLSTEVVGHDSAYVPSGTDTGEAVPRYSVSTTVPR